VRVLVAAAIGSVHAIRVSAIYEAITVVVFAVVAAFDAGAAFVDLTVAVIVLAVTYFCGARILVCVVIVAVTMVSHVARGRLGIHDRIIGAVITVAVAVFVRVVRTDALLELAVNALLRAFGAVLAGAILLDTFG